MSIYFLLARECQIHTFCFLNCSNCQAVVLLQTLLGEVVLLCMVYRRSYWDRKTGNVENEWLSLAADYLISVFLPVCFFLLILNFVILLSAALFGKKEWSYWVSLVKTNQTKNPKIPTNKKNNPPKPDVPLKEVIWIFSSWMVNEK